MVLTGTLYPLLIDALGAGKISVGPPYFGLLFTWLLVPLVAALPIGIFSYWRQDKFSRIARKLRWPLLIAILSGILTLLFEDSINIISAIGVAGGVWIIGASLFYMGQTIGQNKQVRLPASLIAMTLAHAGLGIFLVGLSLVGSIASEKSVRMAPGDQIEVAGYNFEFLGTSIVKGPNFVADEGEFVVTKDAQPVARLFPQKRRYAQGGNTMTEAAIDPGFTRDLYVSLGEPLDDQGTAWAVAIFHKPFIRWIWLGSLFMMAGGLVAAGDKRYRRKKAAAATYTSAEPVKT
jgi:cytochrome c-type biogenesis protein CcmF